MSPSSTDSRRNGRTRAGARNLGRPFRNKETTSAPHTLSLAMGMGGSGVSLNQLAQVAPHLKTELLVADPDVKILEDCPDLSDILHLSTDGCIPTILANRARYGLLREGVPEGLAAFDTSRGVGKIRFAATVTMAYNIELLKSRIRKLLERRMRAFRGPTLKRLIINTVASLAGGSGSSLLIPCSLLLLDTAASMFPSMQVEVHAHVIAPSLFLSVITTPADRLRTMANGAMALRELYISQQPGELDELCQALGLPPIRRPLFDHISYYDQVDSGGEVQTIEDVWARLGINIRGAAVPELPTLEGTRDVNPAMAQLGYGANEGGTAVIDSRHTEIVEVPVEKLCRLYAALRLVAGVQAAIAPVAADRVAELARESRPFLALDTTPERVRARLRPGQRYLCSSALDKLKNGEVLDQVEKTVGRWNDVGRLEMVRNVAALRQELARSAEAAAGVILKNLADSAASPPEMASSLRECLQVLRERRGDWMTQLEKSAAADATATVREHAGALEARVYFGAGRKRARLRTAANASIASQCDREALKACLEAYLLPLHDLLAARHREVEALVRELELISRQVEIQIPALREAIGNETPYYLEVVGPHNLAEIMARLEEEVPARMGSGPQLDLGRLLNLRGRELPEEIQAIAGQLRAQVREFLREKAPDIASFIKYFRVGFDLTAWLHRATQVTLPAKLDLGSTGPGNSPLQVYLVGPDSLKSLMDGIRGIGDSLCGEYCSAPNPYELILRAKISRASFRSIPGLDRMEQAHEEFHVTAPKDHAWGMLISHLSLRKAYEVDFFGRRQADQQTSETTGA